MLNNTHLKMLAIQVMYVSQVILIVISLHTPSNTTFDGLVAGKAAVLSSGVSDMIELIDYYWV
jgi:hypothetical protein